MSGIENVPSKKVEVDSNVVETSNVSNTKQTGQIKQHEYDVISKRQGDTLKSPFKADEPTLPDLNIPSSDSWLNNTSGEVAAIFVELGGWVRRQATEVAKYRYEEMDNFWKKTLELAQTEREKAAQQSNQAIANAVSSGVSGVAGIAQVAGTAWAAKKASAISNPDLEKDKEAAKLRYQEYAHDTNGKPYTREEITRAGFTPYTDEEKAALGLKPEINGYIREPVTSKSLPKTVGQPGSVNYDQNTNFNRKVDILRAEDARARSVEDSARSTVQGFTQIGSSFAEAVTKGLSSGYIESEGEKKAEETKQQTQQRMFQELVSGWSDRFSKLYEMHKELDSAIREVQSSNRQALLSTYR